MRPVAGLRVFSWRGARVMGALLSAVVMTTGCSHQAPAGAAAPTTTTSTSTTPSTPTSTTTTQVASPSAPDVHTVDFRNAVLPADSCGGPNGWPAGRPIVLVDGKGFSPSAEDPFLGAGVMSTDVVGYADFDGDRTADALLSVMCAGTPPERCCASRAGLLQFGLPLRLDPNGDLEIIGSPIMGGGRPNAGRAIHTIALAGAEVVTTETTIYPEGLTEADLGYPPDATITATYRYQDGAWTAVSERW